MNGMVITGICYLVSILKAFIDKHISSLKKKKKNKKKKKKKNCGRLHLST